MGHPDAVLVGFNPNLEVLNTQVIDETRPTPGIFVGDKRTRSRINLRIFDKM